MSSFFIGTPQTMLNLDSSFHSNFEIRMKNPESIVLGEVSTDKEETNLPEAPSKANYFWKVRQAVSVLMDTACRVPQG